MTRLLIVDDSELALDLLAQAIADELGWSVTTATRPDRLCDLLDDRDPFDVAVIDLSFANSDRNGLDALLAVHDRRPACRLVVYTQGDPPLAGLLRCAWDAFALATALSKTTPIPQILRALRRVAADGSAPVDPALQPLLPTTRSPWRSIDGYARLVLHAGHAKLWQALIDLDEEPDYKQLAEHTGLSLSSVRNYRSELLDHLALHDLDRPRMRQMQSFAKRCRPLLEPYIRQRLRGEGASSGSSDDGEGAG